MKKLFLFSLLFFTVTTFQSYGYQPDESTLLEISDLKTQLSSITETDNIALFDLYEQTKDLLLYVNNEKISYILEQLRDYLLTKFQKRKDTAKDSAENLKKDFLEQYQENLDNANAFTENCYGRYNTLDNLSFAYDFPTALTIAVWYRESTCGYYLPKNKNGPFQITSKDYGNGEITKDIFEQTIKDFLEFSKHKINWYNTKNPETPISLTYTNFNYNDIFKYAGLYNGLSGATVYGEIGPANPKYFFERMPGDYENGKKNGLFLQFLKAIEWELNN